MTECKPNRNKLVFFFKKMGGGGGGGGGWGGFQKRGMLFDGKGTVHELSFMTNL